MTSPSPQLKPATPEPNQLCVVQMKDGSEEYAIWCTHYSVYGSGGHFQLGGGGMIGIPIDCEKWWPTKFFCNDDIEMSGEVIEREASND